MSTAAQVRDLLMAVIQAGNQTQAPFTAGSLQQLLHEDRQGHCCWPTASQQPPRDVRELSALRALLMTVRLWHSLLVA